MKFRYRTKSRSKIRLDRGFIKLGDVVKMKVRHQAAVYKTRTQLKKKKPKMMMIPRRLKGMVMKIVIINKWYSEWGVYKADYAILYLKAIWRKKRTVIIRTRLQNVRLYRPKKGKEGGMNHESQKAAYSAASIATIDRQIEARRGEDTGRNSEEIQIPLGVYRGDAS